MPALNWSPSALTILRNKSERQQITRLFDAYFRVRGEKGPDLTGTILHLDLPTNSKSDGVNPAHVSVAPPSLRPRPAAPLSQADRNHYHFHAKFKDGAGWIVEAVLKEEYRRVWWGSRLPK